MPKVEIPTHPVTIDAKNPQISEILAAPHMSSRRSASSRPPSLRIGTTHPTTSSHELREEIATAAVKSHAARRLPSPHKVTTEDPLTKPRRL